uniref:SEC-1 n=1 Tax=Meloidogyne incognita TaxID=6306 RepID=Q25465_MELIC|nr:SEC-1 [Meloidogyne incognita]prf//2103308A esophageal gland protein [Meloidogyne incognita]
MDIITIGGLVAVVAIVIGSCFTIYKLLTRETTFEEVYGNDMAKPLVAEKGKAKGKRNHSKRQSPKKETDNKEVHVSEDDEASGDFVVVKQMEEATKELNLVSSSTSEVNDELENLRIENAELKKEKSEQAEKLVAFEEMIKNKTIEPKQMDDENKKLRSKNDQFSSQLEKQLKDLEHLRAENDQLKREKNEQDERHVIFEQTVKNKLIETHQLGDENKKLRLKCEQFCEQLEKKKTEIAKFCEDRDVAMKEVLKLREERDLAKTFMEKAAADIHSQDIMIRNMETNFEHQRQALQIEFNNERGHFKKVEQEWLNANGQLANELTNANEFVRDLEYKKSQVEQKLVDEQKIRSDAYAQIEKLKVEMSHASELYNNLQAKFEAVQAENEKLVSVNTELKKEATHFQSQNKAMSQSSAELDQFKVTIAELNTKLDQQRSRNQELRDANYKLMDTVKLLQSSKSLVNGTPPIANGGISGSHVGQDSAVVEKLALENKQFKSTLDSLNKQLEEVSKIALEVEIDRDAKVAQIEKMLNEAKS